MLDNIDEIGKRIRDSRIELDYKQQAFAEKIKIDKSSLNRYENGKQTPNLETLVSIANGLDVSLDYLVFGTNKRRAEKQIIKVPYRYKALKSFVNLIESGLIVIVNNQYVKGLVINLKKNDYLLSFFDEVASLCKCKSRLIGTSFDEGIEKIVNDYLPKIFTNNWADDPLYQFPSYTCISEDEEFDTHLDEIIQEYKNDSFED